jgi:putative heme iron utilization protein
MDQASSLLLGRIIRDRSVAALATIHDGLPSASMIPYAVDVADGRIRFVTHVSRLSAHTRDMLESPVVCLLITAAESAAMMPQSLPRVSIAATAAFVDATHPDHAGLKACYLGKFPDTADFFQLGDFSIVALEPSSARFIAGFGRAMTLGPHQLLAAVGGTGTADAGTA